MREAGKSTNNPLDSFDESKFRCKECKKYFEKSSNVKWKGGYCAACFIKIYRNTMAVKNSGKTIAIKNNILSEIKNRKTVNINTDYYKNKDNKKYK